MTSRGSASILALYIGKDLGFFGCSLDEKVLDQSFSGVKNFSLSLLKVLSKRIELMCSEGSIYLMKDLLIIQENIFAYNPSYGSIFHVHSLLSDQSPYQSILLPKNLVGLLEYLIVESMNKPWFQFLKLYGVNDLDCLMASEGKSIPPPKSTSSLDKISEKTIERMYIGSIRFNNKIILDSIFQMTKEDFITSFGSGFELRSVVLQLELTDRTYSFSQYPVVEGNTQAEREAFSLNSQPHYPEPLQSRLFDSTHAVATFWFSQFLILADLNDQAHVMHDLAAGLLEEPHNFHLEKTCNCHLNGSICKYHEEWHIHGIDVLEDD